MARAMGQDYATSPHVWTHARAVRRSLRERSVTNDLVKEAVRCVPPAGFEPATPALGETSSSLLWPLTSGFSGALVRFTGSTGLHWHQFAPRMAPRSRRLRQLPKATATSSRPRPPDRRFDAAGLRRSQPTSARFELVGCLRGRYDAGFLTCTYPSR